ncbi:HNH endonuclease signature motif containing protein [Zhenhengia yiwuensis]|uniref:HNH endonuclease signature motif containing protein n=1 Tax=Zhenhengia yiwuensis TaxID=2763666 RepID=UPI002A74E3EA|nr:HNH endonuclease signature motif containing protein [Zhenhengia yiwuensis]MDY3366760.1 HNH endonuclease signature motif containing protein [Zhenhengia yiwuensis]
MEKQFILFDPRTAERKVVTLELLAGMAGRTKEGLRYALKHRSKIRSLNCYILEEHTPISVFRELLAKEVIPDEVWRDIPNSRWQVSSYGRYRRWAEYKKGFVYRVPYHGTKTSSYRLNIPINGERQELMAHEKVVEVFIGEVPKDYVVYHKDGNKSNNHVDNLGFIKRSELVVKQATAILMKPVIQIDEVTKEIVAEYRTMTAAAKANFTGEATIRQAIKENRSAIGFIWKWEEQVADELLYAD